MRDNKFKHMRIHYFHHKYLALLGSIKIKLKDIILEVDIFITLHMFLCGLNNFVTKVVNTPFENFRFKSHRLKL